MIGKIIRALLMAPGLFFGVIFLAAGTNLEGAVNAHWRFSAALKDVFDRGASFEHAIAFVIIWASFALLAFALFDGGLNTFLARFSQRAKADVSSAMAKENPEGVSS